MLSAETTANDDPHIFLLKDEAARMNRVQCDLCDGRGHNQGQRGKDKESAKKCPVRKVLQKRCGRGKAAKLAFGRAMNKVRSNHHAFKIGRDGG